MVDRYERESRLTDALHSLGVKTETRRLPVADYRAGDALVERKSVRDLHLAIIKGRFWPQIGRLSRTAKRPYLRPASVRGALLAVDELGIGIIRTRDPRDSALWLKLIASRTERARPRTRTYAQLRAEPAEAMLAAVPGISTVIAQALLARFGSVAAILEAGPEQWLSVGGVGPKRSAALKTTLGEHRSSPSRAQSARPDPST